MKRKIRFQLIRKLSFVNYYEATLLSHFIGKVVPEAYFVTNIMLTGQVSLSVIKISWIIILFKHNRLCYTYYLLRVGCWFQSIQNSF